MEKDSILFRFGFLGVRKNFVTPDQIIEALEIQLEENQSENKHRLIGEIMVDKGFMNPAQVNEILKEMTRPDAPIDDDYRKRFGNLATAKGYITLQALKETVKAQVKEENDTGRHRLTGEILIENGYMNLIQINEILEELL